MNDTIPLQEESEHSLEKQQILKDLSLVSMYNDYQKYSLDYVHNVENSATLKLAVSK